MFSLKVFNEKEVLACCRKAEKRKGKRVTLGEVPSGSLVRFFEIRDGKEVTKYNLSIVELKGEDGETNFSIFGAYDRLLGAMVVMGSGGELNDESKKIPVQLVMQPEEVVQPKTESSIKTSVMQTKDGLFHCQNFIFGNRGQHFVVNQSGFEKISKDGREILDIDEGDCDCGLKASGDIREYDGKTWHNNNFSV